MIIGYCSISSLEPASWLDAQKHQLASIGAEMFYCERTSIFGRKLELERAVEAANKGDVIAVTKPYRIALSTRGVVTLIERLGLKSVGIRIVNTPVDTSTTTGRTRGAPSSRTSSGPRAGSTMSA